MTDTVAAAAYGAPAGVRSGQLLHFYVPEPTLVRRARTLLGGATSAADARCSVAVAPVRAVCQRRVAGPAPVAESIAADIALHVDLWFVRRRLDTIELMRAAGGRDVVLDDLDLVGELLRGGARRSLS